MIARLFALLALLTLPLAPHAASAFTYDETTSGDISNFPTFSFDMGTNTVSGQMSFDGVASQYDFDSFFIDLPLGGAITAVDFFYQNVVPRVGGSQGFGISPKFADPNTFNPIVPGQDIQLYPPASADTSPISLFANALPLSQALVWNSAIWNFSGDAGGSWDYTTTFTVQAVPEPVSASLVGTALLALVGLRRRAV